MPSMSSTTLKLPEFQTTSPATWLLLCESTFVIKKVSKITEKFHHVVAALPASVAILLRDVLTMRPTVGPDGVEVDHRWELLQERLKAMYSLNDFEAFQRVADFPNLQPAQKPSQLLAAMTALVPEGVTPCPWQFKNQYLAKLPQHLRAVCLSKDFTTLMQMALCADAIMDLHGSRSQPSTSWSAAAVTPSDQHDLSNSNFRGEESGFQQVLASNFGGRGQFCFYHTRFGEKALKCVPPCNWSTQQPASNQNAPKSTRSGNLTRAGRR